MLISSVLTGTLAAKLKAHAKLSAQLAFRTQILFDTDRLLQKAKGEREILDVITELKRVLNEKELLVTIRTVAEGGEENGFRFDYFETIRKILEQQTADYVDVEAARDEEKVKALCQKYSNSKT